VGCAQIEPPSGGPEDTAHPRVVGTYPDSGAVRVPQGDSLALLFSEPMNRRTVENSFFLSPPVEFSERRWEKQVWILRLRKPLEPGRTYAGLLGSDARDRHNLGPDRPWSFAFSTGDTLDTGKIAGVVVGQRYSPKGAFVYVWPWDSGPPDTTREGYPVDPIRLGQTDAQGVYELDYLPRGKALRVCAMYDRQGNRQFDPNTDRWACADDAVLIGDTTRVVEKVDVYIADPDEPGTVAGSVIDSLCLRSQAVRQLVRARARRDSLREWLEGRSDTIKVFTDSARQGTAEVRGRMSLEDSLRIGRQLLSVDSIAAAANAESAYCALPILARLVSGDTTVVREARGPASFRWTDVPPGIYRLRAFRDLNRDGRPQEDEPAGQFHTPLEVRPLHTLDSLAVLLESPKKGGSP
jgi:hypothetical protein